LERGFGFCDGGEGGVDYTEFGCGGGGDDDSGGGTVGYEGAHEDGVVAVGDGDGVAWWGLGDYVYGFYYGCVFACQRGFIDF